MSPEANQHLDKARQCLAKARAMLGINLADEAGRSIAGYGIGPHAVVSGEDANEAVQVAHRFIEHVGSLLGEESGRI